MQVQKSNGLMTLTGVFGVCGVRNNNQRIYETNNYSKMVTEMQQRIQNEGGIPGELEHPQSMNITLENVSHKITDINIDENGLVTGSITLLNTPKGKIAQAIVEGGLPLFISSRATGQVDSKTGNVALERIATYDLVGSPGFSQAKLKLNENQIAESINESNVFYIGEMEEDNNINENNLEDMELKEILEKIEKLESRVEDLVQENQELREQIETLEENNGVATSLDETYLENLANSIQQWIVEEYSPKVQEWILEEYTNSDELNDVIAESIDNESVIEEASEDIKSWMLEEVTPLIQDWIVEEYSPEIEKWVVEEYSQGIQNWVVEEYSPEIDKFINEEYSKKVDEMIKESKSSSLSEIDSTLKLLESMEPTKPTYSRKSLITENANEPLFVQQMPAEMRVKWDLASNDVKESITRRARLYNFTNEGAVQRFWENINLDNIQPSKNIYEGLENIHDEYERQIRMKLRNSRFRK
jgi:regulator of replication initiation timing